MEAKCYRAMRRAGQRHGPRRIAKHPELSGLLPLPACKGRSSELRLVFLDDLLAEMLTMRKGRITTRKEMITMRKGRITTRKGR